MIHPSYNELIEILNEKKDVETPEIDSRYSVVIASAKRARQLIDGQEPLADRVSTYKPLSIAVEEIREKKVYITKEGVDEFKRLTPIETSEISFDDSDMESEDAR